MSGNSSAKKKTPKTPFLLLGLFLILFSLVILGRTFYPIVRVEIKYQLQPQISKEASALTKEIEPVDGDFGIVIPKIQANAKIIANVDPYNSYVYQKALTQGIAHAKGSAYPGQSGNIFLFAHSAGNFYQANRYNAVFYLLNKLEKDDLIYLYYQGEKSEYKVTEKKLVSPKEIDYLVKKENKKQLTLMTCWPPGTTLKRLIITACLED